MASFEGYVFRVKPTLDAFLSNPTKHNLDRLEHELSEFDWVKLKLFHFQILVPLIAKLEEFPIGQNQDLSAGTIKCLRVVTSKLYLNDVRGLRTILFVVLKHIRNCDSATARPNCSEEIKLAAVECFAESFQRSTSDVLEEFYTKDSSLLLAQILLTLVEFVEKEKSKKLVITSLQSLMIVFYVHEEADKADVVLRNKVADCTFIFLPKIVTVLLKTAIADEKVGETIKSAAIKALGRILCIMFEQTTDDFLKQRYDINSFQKLFKLNDESHPNEEVIRDNKDSNGKQLIRSAQWVNDTTKKLRIVFLKTTTFRSHPAFAIRREFSEMSCTLLTRCSLNLKSNFITLLENVVAMSEDGEEIIRRQCQNSLYNLQRSEVNNCIFDDNAELLFDSHLGKLSGILHRCDESEQYAELLFLKGFLRNISEKQMQLLLTVPKNLEMLIMCLLSALKLRLTIDLLNEEHCLRNIVEEVTEYEGEIRMLQWLQFKHLSSKRCIKAVRDICVLLGNIPIINHTIFDYCLELLRSQHDKMNELILLLAWIGTEKSLSDKNNRLELVIMLLEEVLNEKHWFLALRPDNSSSMRNVKPSYWLSDITPGLYESAVEVRTQDCDSDDENDINNYERKNRVGISDAQFNVMHTCLVLDTLALCASFMGESFHRYIFQSLHRVLLKLATNNRVVHEAAKYAFVNISKALRFAKAFQLIDASTDYITYHINSILRRPEDSCTAVDILSVVLQFITRDAIPHLESIFQTICDECSKCYQSDNIYSYIKVFNAFLIYVKNWREQSYVEVDIEKNLPESTDVLTDWLNILTIQDSIDDNFSFEHKSMDCNSQEVEHNLNSEKMPSKKDDEEISNIDNKPSLPRHIEVIKNILHQVIKFVSSDDQTLQILSLECLSAGLPLLEDYENELLPLVHMIWQPMVEKFRQKNPIVLNRCFNLFNILSLYSKEFILKRSLSDVIPFLREFLKEAAPHSAALQYCQTQEYKLQKKLLLDLANLIIHLQIDGKYLNEIVETSTLYLSKAQPEELQELTLMFFEGLRFYNGPLLYLVIVKASSVKDYEENVMKILTSFGIPSYSR